MPQTGPWTTLGGVITVERRSDDFMAFITGNRGLWGAGKSIDEAVGSVIRSHPELVAEAVLNQSAYVDELRGTLQMTAQALEDAVAGDPVPNVPHCMAAAGKLLKGTDYELD